MYTHTHIYMHISMCVCRCMHVCFDSFTRHRVLAGYGSICIKMQEFSDIYGSLIWDILSTYDIEIPPSSWHHLCKHVHFITRLNEIILFKFILLLLNNCWNYILIAHIIKKRLLQFYRAYTRYRLLIKFYK